MSEKENAAAAALPVKFKVQPTCIKKINIKRVSGTGEQHPPGNVIKRTFSLKVLGSNTKSKNQQTVLTASSSQASIPLKPKPSNNHITPTLTHSLTKP